MRLSLTTAPDAPSSRHVWLTKLSRQTATGFLMIEILAVITAPHFTAGIVLWDDEVVVTANILRYMQRWPRKRVREYCAKRGWKVSVVYEQQRTRDAE